MWGHTLQDNSNDNPRNRIWPVKKKIPYMWSSISRNVISLIIFKPLADSELNAAMIMRFH